MAQDWDKDLKAQIDKNIENDVKPFLFSYGFVQDPNSNLRFIKNDCAIIFHHYGFHPHDYPWNLDVELQKNDNYKSEERLNSIYLAYYKNAIAPREDWQKKEMNLDLEYYSACSEDIIDSSFGRIINDLKNFCLDFLNNDYKRFNYARQLQYLEYLLKPQVFGTYYYGGRPKEIEVRYNQEIE